MNKDLMKLKEIAEKRNALRGEVAECEDEKRLSEIKEELETLTKEETTVRTKMELMDELKDNAVPESRGKEMTAIELFAKENRMSIPMFVESRATLVSSGKLATPTKVSTEIGALPEAVSSIVDDVDVIDATGSGSWSFPYKKTGATAADHTEGAKITGTEATFDKVEIGQKSWAVLSEISNQVKLTTPVNYANAIQKESYLALRKKAKAVITKAALSSPLVKKVPSIKIDADYLRTIVLGFGGSESVGAGTKLYLNRADLIAIGKVRTTGEKIAHYKITFTDENNGYIEENGLSVAFSINDDVPVGEQLYGQPKALKLLLWGDYLVETDESGEYFAKDVMAVRGKQTANAGLVVPEAMHRIGQSTLA